VDKSFEGLLISGILHAVLVWILIFAKFPAYVPAHQDATEVTLIERSNEKSKVMVTETTTKEPELKDLKDTADYLSQFTKRVKKQLRARQDGPTVNSLPQPSVANQAAKVGGQATKPRTEEGIGLPRQNGGQAMRTVAIGSSSIAEYIPGVEEGAFTALNTDQFTYYTFFQRMNEQVRNRWVGMIRNYVNSLSTGDLQTLARQERQTLIEIVLEQDGQFRNAVLHTSSGARRLDQIPAEAFEAAAPFPNPPHGMVEPDGLIHLKYAFVLQFRAPSFGPGTN
jgi:TonB family protein